LDSDGNVSRRVGRRCANRAIATFSGVNIYRFGADGKVAELWNHRDDLGFMEQIGAHVYAGAAPDTEPSKS
jgi:hypothetical protein